MLSSQSSNGKGNIYYVRHGSTNLNSADKLRSWNDVPLDAKGKLEAHKVGKELKGKRIESIITSDLSRAEDTGKIVSEETGIKNISSEKALRPWNLGELAGRDVKDTLDVLKNYAENKPDSSIKGGESFNTFKKRYITGIKNIMAQNAGKNIIIVSHHRGDRLLDGWEKKGDNPQMQIDLPTFFQKGMDPGKYRVIKFSDLQKNGRG